jgi:hypothetical protein
MKQVLAFVQQGLQSLEHTQFVQTLSTHRGA